MKPLQVLRLLLFFSILFSASLIFYCFSNLAQVNGRSRLRRDPSNSEGRKLQKVLKKAIMPDRTVIIAIVNQKWAHPSSVFDLFLEGFRVGLGTKTLLNHLIIFTMDGSAFQYCRSVHRHCLNLATYRINYATWKPFENLHHLKLGWRKIELLGEVLELGYNVLFTGLGEGQQGASGLGNFLLLLDLVFWEGVMGLADGLGAKAGEGLLWWLWMMVMCTERFDLTVLSKRVIPLKDTIDADVMWFRNPFPHFHSGAEIITASDPCADNQQSKTNRADGGFFYLKSNAITVEFFKYWKTKRVLHPNSSDQLIFETIKDDMIGKMLGLRIIYLDTDYFGSFCQSNKDMSKLCTMHAKCYDSIDRKVHHLKDILDVWRNSTLPSSGERKQGLKIANSAASS
ncbi:unnamed protein product [Camellia sinensis]